MFPPRADTVRPSLFISEQEGLSPTVQMGAWACALILAVHTRASHNVMWGSHCPAKGVIGKKMSISLKTWNISETVSLHMNTDLNTGEVKAAAAAKLLQSCPTQEVKASMFLF